MYKAFKLQSSKHTLNLARIFDRALEELKKYNTKVAEDLYNEMTREINSNLEAKLTIIHEATKEEQSKEEQI